MSTQQSTVDYIIEQIAEAGVVFGRKMFGEYAIYCDGKMVALVCDDQLLIKPTIGGRAYLGDVDEASPYRGAKPCFLISGVRWDDADWLADLVRISAAELPSPTGKTRGRERSASATSRR